MNRCSSLVCLLAATLAFAAPPEAEDPATAPTRSLIDKVLLKPLATREHAQSRLSRALLPPTARRVRVLDAVPQKDAEGKQFVTFAVDVRHGWDLGDDGEPAPAQWQEADISGCAYPDTGEVFITRKGSYFASGILLGKRTQPAPKQVCVGETAQVAAAK